ncbi:hypothetical protein J1614_003098 [Plenodomus biglobosus]|nr:hypothetical protein J1614_003098 [Plenodomus biglobosus]
MSCSLPLLKRRITLEEALVEDDDVLHELSYPQERLNFYFYLLEHREDIEKLVSFHLGVPRETCKAAKDFREWVHGSFNACVPIYIDDTAKIRVKKVFIRFPLPYKVGESQYPGNAEEKLRCEVATYIWIQNNCPDIPIPCLRGFGFPKGRSVLLRGTALRLLGYPAPSRYVGRSLPLSIDTGYLIVDCVKEGEMLSECWNSLRHDRDRKANLFADMSRIILSLARVPFTRIGSLTIDHHGIISLTNRPLTCTLQQLENCGIPTDIPRNLTYSTADAYLSDLLACHDNRIRYMPNSIHDTADGQQQLSALTMMRALLRHFTDRNLRHGPFVLMLTDLHQSNIFVNSDWHITSIIDLEWACTLPIEMLHPPYWLGGTSIDRLVGKELEAFRSVHAEFMTAFEREERSLGKDDILHTRIMRKGWEIGNFWYFSALDCLNGLYSLYMSHIQRIFAPIEDSGPEFDRTISAYWGPETTEFIAEKVKDKEAYSNRLREQFTAESNRLDMEDDASSIKHDTATE